MAIVCVIIQIHLNSSKSNLNPDRIYIKTIIPTKKDRLLSFSFGPYGQTRKRERLILYQEALEVHVRLSSALLVFCM